MSPSGSFRMRRRRMARTASGDTPSVEIAGSPSRPGGRRDHAVDCVIVNGGACHRRERPGDLVPLESVQEVVRQQGALGLEHGDDAGRSEAGLFIGVVVGGEGVFMVTRIVNFSFFMSEGEARNQRSLELFSDIMTGQKMTYYVCMKTKLTVPR